MEYSVIGERVGSGEGLRARNVTFVSDGELLGVV